MKKRWMWLYTVAAMLLILALLYSLIEGLMFDRHFFEKQYLQYGQAQAIGMSHGRQK